MWLLENAYKKDVIRQLTKRCLEFNTKLDAVNIGELSDADKQVLDQTKQYTINALKLLKLALNDQLIRDNLFNQFDSAQYWGIKPNHAARQYDPLIFPVVNLIMRIELYVLKHRLLFIKEKQKREQIEKLLCEYDVEYKFASLLQSDEHCIQKILEVSMNLNTEDAQSVSGELIKLWAKAPRGDMSLRAGYQITLIPLVLFSIFAITMTILTAGISIGLLAVTCSLGAICMIYEYLKEENQIKNARSLQLLATTPTPSEPVKQNIFKLSARFFKPSVEAGTSSNNADNLYHSNFSYVL